MIWKKEKIKPTEAFFEFSKIFFVKLYHDRKIHDLIRSNKHPEKKDFVFIHVEAPDEAGHNGDAKAKINAIEHIDKEIVGPILEHFKKDNDFRIMVLPDHATPVEKRTHTREPVCFVMYGKGVLKDGASTYSESAAREKGLKFTSGEALMEYFMRGAGI